MTMKYIVQLTDNSWIAPWEGDPGRTLRKRSAALFDTQQRAERALNKAREYRPFPEAQVISISIDTDHTRRPVCPHCNQERGCVEALALVRDGDEVEASELLGALKTTYYPAKTARSAHRFHYECVFFMPRSEGGLELMATDGHRLALVEIPNHPTIAHSTAVPMNLVTLLLAAKPKGPVQWQEHDGCAFFRFDGHTIAGPSLSTEVPDFRRLISVNGAHCKVQRSELLEALKVMNCWKGADNTAVLSFTGNLLLSRKTLFGEFNHKIKTTFEGSPRSMGVNPRHLLDAVKAATGDNIELRVLNATDPIVVEPVGGGATHVVMPTRL